MPQPTLAAPSAGSSLAEWLAYLEHLHPSAMDFGLERIGVVRERLGLDIEFPVITVGGTNGKGSTCAFLDCFLRCAGYRSGCYTSPHLLRYNERVRIGGREAADAELVRAFERVEAARGEVSLTYFEFGTLAAVLMFRDAGVDAALLEVGLGGRLDAVNLFAPDCAVLTSVGLDHMQYLGDTREAIGFEKAGIFRPLRPAVVADSDPPASVLRRATEIGAELLLIDRDFGAVPREQDWIYWSIHGRRSALPWPSLRGAFQLGNASAAIMALESIRARLPVDMGAIRRGLVEVELPGRFQVLPGRPMVILDVAHNPHAALRLRDDLARMRGGRTFAVFAMLRDKDIAGVAQALSGVVDRWFVAPLPGPRGETGTGMLEAIRHAQAQAVAVVCDDVGQALHRARGEAGADDKIVVFGSFLTVAAALASTHSNRG
ncbi:MAG: bifunctional tetrahydrofolate synthase/dihydrofolate synthase [Burkholderiales bacterium]|nr:bifunctional tetrahydrofolate synthase/dihydrofolate synthase [Burkholderiales bacterium]